MAEGDRLGGLAALTSQNAGAIRDYLDDFRKAVGARDVLLVSMAGHLLEQWGPADTYEPGIVGVLLANGMAAAAEMARVLDEAGGLSVFVHEGARWDLYAATVTDDIVLALIFDRGQGGPRVGTVYLYLKRAVEDVRVLILGQQCQTEVMDLNEAPTWPAMRRVGTATPTRPRKENETGSSPTLSYEEATRLGLIRDDNDKPKDA